jgi:copper chaperone CopZ
VRSALLNLDGVESVTVDFATKTATVNGTALDGATLAKAFRGTRFSAAVKN